MNRAYFTFGQAHTHFVAGKAFDKDVVCQINVEKVEDARAMAFNAFGPRWAFEYGALKKIAKEYYPKGVVELNPDGETLLDYAAESKGKKETPCHACKHKRNVPGNAHVSCAFPSVDTKGAPHGISNGWFDYPDLFDPAWRLNECKHYEEKSS